MSAIDENQMILMEEIDLNALQTIRDNFDALYDGGKLGRFVDAKNGYSVIQDKQVILGMICEFFKKRTKDIKQKYKFACGIKWGRMFSDGTSLQGISRVIRHTISRDLYWDIDIVNAHPVILLKYCVDNKLNVPKLEKYVNNREEMLKTITCLVDQDGIQVSRDEAKCILLAIINGGTRTWLFKKDALPDWISLFEKEMEMVADHFISTDKGKKFYKRAQGKKDKNVKGSTLNYYLCEQENMILQSMYSFLKSIGHKIGVFCFDGLMVYKKYDKDTKALLPFPNHHLKLLEDTIKEDTSLGYDLKILIKSMNEDISLLGLSKREEQVAKITHKSCADLFYELNEALYVYTKESGWYLLNHITNKYENTRTIDGMKIFVMEVLIPIMTKRVEIANIGEDKAVIRSNLKKLDELENSTFIGKVIELLQNKYLRRETFEPNPSKILNGINFNVFNGFYGGDLVEEYDPYLVDDYIDHITYIAEDSSKYILDWISQLIQRPWEKTGVSLVVTSTYQGNGKDTIGSMIKKIIGISNSLTTPRLAEDIFGRFNGHLRYKFFIHLPEVSGSVIRPHWSLFKDMIVSSTDLTEFKGLGQLELPSYTRYFITSNNDNPVPIENGDRRFCYINSNSKPKDKAYYDKLYAGLDSDQVIYSLYKFFMDRDISTIDWKQDRVNSTFIDEVRVMALPHTTTFLLKFLEEDDLLDTKGQISSADLWDYFRQYCEVSNIHSKMTKISFCMVISKNKDRFGFTKVLYEVNKKTKKGWKINLDVLKQELVNCGAITVDDLEAYNQISLLRQSSIPKTGLDILLECL